MTLKQIETDIETQGMTELVADGMEIPVKDMSQPAAEIIVRSAGIER